MPRLKINYSVYKCDFDRLDALNPGEFLVIDLRMANTFKAIIYYYNRGKGPVKIYYRFLRVSEDKVYVFKVDVSKKLNYELQTLPIAV